MDPHELLELEQRLSEELRRNSELRRILLNWIEHRESSAKTRLSVRLLDERNSDTLRGNIDELHSLKNVIENGGA